MVPILEMLILMLIVVMVALIGVLYYMSRPRKKKEEVLESSESEEEEEDEKKKQAKTEPFGKFHGVLNHESVLDFMEFDEIVDDMIVRKGGRQYIMVLQCNGVNYDLMSEQEKIGVEEGFVQFLNTLRFPIQLYVQSRTLNLRDIITTYKNRVDSLAQDIQKLDAKIVQVKAQGNKALLDRLNFERRRKINVLEYGIDITDYVERLSANKNVLQQKTYVVVSYYSAEIGGSLENYSKEEIYNMCFSELYTRCQNIASALATAQIQSNILDSEELAELLYVAYNRDEAELLQFSKALNSQFDALYSTGKDVLQKKQEKLDQEINLDAIDLATDSILKADRIKQQEDLQNSISKTQKIKEKALELLDTYEEQLHPRVYDLAKEEVNLEIEKREQEEKEKNAPKEQLPEGDEHKKTVVRKKSDEQPVQEGQARPQGQVEQPTRPMNQVPNQEQRPQQIEPMQNQNMQRPVAEQNQRPVGQNPTNIQ
jgi:hypothetical protein